jgi:hypothetical protein
MQDNLLARRDYALLGLFMGVQTLDLSLYGVQIKFYLLAFLFFNVHHKLEPFGHSPPRFERDKIGDTHGCPLGSILFLKLTPVSLTYNFLFRNHLMGHDHVNAISEQNGGENGHTKTL